jgi:hypothetical protein
MHFNWRLLFFMAFNNSIHKNIYISSDHRIWVLSGYSLWGIWLLSMAEAKILNLIIHPFFKFIIVNTNRWQDHQITLRGSIHLRTTYP